MEGFAYTPFANLKEGDVFVRVAGRAVLLTNIKGNRPAGHPEWFYPAFSPTSRLLVHKMIRLDNGSLSERFFDE